MTFFPKLATGIGTGVGTVTAYRLIGRKYTQSEDGSITVSLDLTVKHNNGPEVTESAGEFTLTKTEVKTMQTNLESKLGSNFYTTFKDKNGLTELTPKQEMANFLEEVKSKNIPNVPEDDSSILDSCVISSPLDSQDLSQINEGLQDIITVGYCVSFLLFMLLIIITVRYGMDQNWSFPYFKSSKIGNFLSYIIDKWLAVWRVSSLMWIYLIILVCLFCEISIVIGVQNILNFLSLFQ